MFNVNNLWFLNLSVSTSSKYRIHKKFKVLKPRFRRYILRRNQLILQLTEIRSMIRLYRISKDFQKFK